MAPLELDAICRHCSARFRGMPRTDLLGIRRFTCPSCGREVDYPLAEWRRAVYWVLVILMGIGVLTAFLQRKFAWPAIVALAVILALVKDARLRREVRSAEDGPAKMEPR